MVFTIILFVFSVARYIFFLTEFGEKLRHPHIMHVAGSFLFSHRITISSASFKSAFCLKNPTLSLASLMQVGYTQFKASYIQPLYSQLINAAMAQEHICKIKSQRGENEHTTRPSWPRSFVPLVVVDWSNKA